MMQFFRKYQRFFLIIISAIVIISFVFFGTFNTFSREVPDPVVVTAVDGSLVHESEMNAWLRFIASDADDKILRGGAWGPNHLNDGVMRKDFLESGLAVLVAEPFMDSLKNDFDKKLVQEKLFKPYTHPGTPFLSSETIWGFFAPKIKENLEFIRQSEPSLNKELLEAQIALYLEERKFPAPYQKQVIAYQEGQYGVRKDSALRDRNLNLFGYSTTEEWFGPQLMELSAQVVINGAAIAEKQGHVVTEKEALSSLLYNNEMSFQQLQKANSQHLGVRTSAEYFREQLRILGIDQKTAVTIWRKVMLFRQLSDSAKNALVAGALHEASVKKRDVEIFEMPKPMQLKSEKELQQLATYMELIAEPGANVLDVPSQIKSLDEIRKDAPELVQKVYTVKVSHVAFPELMTNVSIKELLNRELEEQVWPKMMLQVPALGVRMPATREERLAALDALDPKTRQAADNVVRTLIVSEHPEWISKALATKESKEYALKIKDKGTQLPFEGILDVKALQALLDQKEPLLAYTQDDKHYYTIEVTKQDIDYQVLTFEEALQDKSLDKRVTKNFTALCDAIIADAQEHGHLYTADSGMSRGDFAALYRFYYYVRQKKNADLSHVTQEGSDVLNVAFEGKKLDNPLLAQFQLEKREATIPRKENDAFFEIPVGAISEVLINPKTGPYFFYVLDEQEDEEAHAALIKEAQRAEALSASRTLFQGLIQEMLDKQALKVREHVAG